MPRESCQRAYPQRGGWRAEKRKPMARIRRCAGASRRANRGGYDTGPRFSLYRRVVAAHLSASFWRGFLVTPGGGSGAARRTRCERGPQAPHPVPLTQRLARTPLSGRGDAMIRQVLRGGDKFARRRGATLARSGLELEGRREGRDVSFEPVHRPELLIVVEIEDHRPLHQHRVVNDLGTDGEHAALERTELRA